MKHICQFDLSVADVAAGLSRLKSAYEELAHTYNQAELAGCEDIDPTPIRLAAKQLEELERLISDDAPTPQVITAIDRFADVLAFAAGDDPRDAVH
jgi:hypothetical protein